MNFDDFYRRGLSRRVLKLNKYVIKFPVFKVFTMKELIDCWKDSDASIVLKVRVFVLNFLYGFWCNYHEHQIYLKLKDTIYEDRFAKVYFCCPLGLFLIQEKVYQPKNFKYKILKRYEDIFFSIKLEGLNWTVDANHFNFGFRGKRLVCLDLS